MKDLGPIRNGKYQCPVCQEYHLVVTKNNGKVLVDCKTPDCPKGAAYAMLKDDVPKGKAVPAQGDPANWPGLTMAQLAKQKQLSVSVMAAFGIYDTTYKGKRAIAFPYGQTVNGQWIHTATKVRGGSSHQTRWLPGENNKTVLVPFGLCRPDWEDDSDLFLVEGESDVITLELYGIRTLGIPGAGTWKSEWSELPPIKNAPRIFLGQEPDGGGDTFAKRISENLPIEKLHVFTWPVDAPDANAYHLKYVDVPRPPAPLPFYWDPAAKHSKADYLELIQFREEQLKSGTWTPGNPFLNAFEELIETARPLVGSYKLTPMSEVKMKPVEWLWPGRVPKVKLTIFGGAPGTAKSMVSCNVAAILSKGLCFPDCKNANEPMDVLMLSAEDDAADTIAPRLEATGADRSRIFDVSVTMPGDQATTEDRSLAFDRDLKLMEKILREHPSIQLVVVDPISSYLGAINMNNEQQVRSVLVPLRELAGRTGVTFLLLAHLNKRSDVNALGRILGATGMVGVVRAVWLFVEDKREDVPETQHLMVYGKLNIARKCDGLTYTIAEKQILPEPADPTPYVVWGEATDISADAAMGMMGDLEARVSKVELAEAFLKKILATGKKLKAEIDAAAKAAGIKDRTLDTAKKKLGVEAIREGGHWYWTLPVTIEAEGLLIQ